MFDSKTFSYALLGHPLLFGQPPPVAVSNSFSVHESEYPCDLSARQGQKFQLRSYRIGRISEKPSHIMMVNGIPTRRKSENL